MNEKQWKLGEDLIGSDNILDQVTFNELIMTVRSSCNCISEKNIKATLDEILKLRTYDAKELLNRNMAEIMDRILEGKPLKMSFYEGTLNREVARRRIEETDKKIVYTYGLGYRNPTTNRKPISKDEAFKILKEQSLLDVNEADDYIHLNAFSDNDMW